jgi:rubredoxin
VPDLRLDLRRGRGDPEHGIAPGTAWADVPMNWTCPECGARKEDFEMVQI